eukprot:2668836-Heterocapsa_arctica.AAC.1
MSITKTPFARLMAVTAPVLMCVMLPPPFWKWTLWPAAVNFSTDMSGLSTGATWKVTFSFDPSVVRP